jgi:hypothetical protein
MTRFCTVLFLVLVALMAGCSGEAKKPAQTTVRAPSGPPKFAEGFDVKVVATTDGAAYAYSSFGGVWYLRGATATLVKETEESGIPSGQPPAAKP